MGPRPGCAHPGHCCAYHHMFDVIRTHPPAQGHGSERGLEAVHVEQEGAIVTLDERGHTTTPAREREAVDSARWENSRVLCPVGRLPFLNPSRVLPHSPPSNSVPFTIRKMDEAGGHHWASHHSSKRNAEKWMLIWSRAKVAVRAGMINARYLLGKTANPALIFLLLNLNRKQLPQLKKKKKSLATFPESHTTRGKDFSSALSPQ